MTKNWDGNWEKYLLNSIYVLIKDYDYLVTVNSSIVLPAYLSQFSFRGTRTIHFKKSSNSQIVRKIVHKIHKTFKNDIN